MNSTRFHWQDVLEPQFVQRLTRPLRQPGVTNNQLANTILSRAEHFHNRLPLLTQQRQRWKHRSMLLGEQVPIVYAQPIFNENTIAPTQPVSSPQVSTLEFAATSGVETSGETPLQAKFESSQTPIINSKGAEISAYPSSIQLHSVPLSQSSSSLELPSIPDERVIDFVHPVVPGDITPVSASPDALKMPAVTPNAVLSASDSAGTMPLQAKLETPRPSVPRVSQPSQLAASPAPRPITPVTSNLAATSAQSIASPQPPLEFIASEKTFQPLATDPTPSSSSSLVEVTKQVREAFSNQSTEYPSAIPTVTARPTLSGFVNFGALPLQMDFENSPVQSLSTSLASPFTAEITSYPNTLPIVSTYPITLPDLGISESDAAINKMVVQAKWNPVRSTHTHRTPNISHLAGIFEPQLPVVKPFLLSAPSIQETVQETAHPQNSLPLVPAQSFVPSQSLVPLLFSTSGVKGDRQGGFQFTSPPQTATSHTENGFSRVQATAASSLELSSSTDSSLAEPQANQTVASAQSQTIDLEAMAAKVERRLLRRLVIESERRGQHRWGLRS